MYRFVALALLTACGGPADLGWREDPITRGHPDDDHVAVGLVGVTTDDGWTFHCSGTLVGPTTVLTAAHCLFDVDDRRLTARTLVFAIGDAVFDVARSNVAPGYDPEAYADWEDAARLVLAIAPDVAPIPLASNPPHVDDDAIVVGFGATSASGAGFGRRRRVHVVLGEVTDRELAYDGREGSACYGDSGGPVLVAGRVVGVTSRMYGRACRGFSVAQRADVLVPWLRRDRGDVCADEC